jgi:dihydropyrimidinase
MCSPPPREKANQPYVWRGLETDVLNIVSSDHAPYLFNDAEHGKLRGLKEGFKKVPNGVPGLEVRLPLLFSEGVGKGRFDIHRFVALTATTPAKLYGLAPRKGSIAVGADADIVIWDPDKQVTITQDLLHDAMDYTPYEGIEVTGWPAITLSRGEAVWRDGKFLGKPGRGKFLPRALSPMVKPRGQFWSGFDPNTGTYTG